MSQATRKLMPDRLAWIGFTVFAIGLIVDAVWHATHEEFESASDQVQAHFVLWIGVVLVLTAAVWGLTSGRARLGYSILLSAAASNAMVHGWHFFEHSQNRDPGLPHLLLLITNVAIFIGVVWIRMSGAGARPTEKRAPIET